MAGPDPLRPGAVLAHAAGVEPLVDASPTLVTSFTEFERAFGGLGDVGTAGSTTA